MEITIKKTLGDTEYIFKVQAGKGKDALIMAGVFGDMPTVCSKCGSPVHLSSHKAKEYKFVEVVCNNVPKCGAKAGLGEYKDGSGYYWKDFEIYKAGAMPGEGGEMPVSGGEPIPEEQF